MDTPVNSTIPATPISTNNPQISHASITRDPSLTRRTYVVYLTVHHRGELSLDEHRRRLGFSAYHWAILITPASGGRSYAFDTTNGATTEPSYHANTNSEHQWRFRWKGNVRPGNSTSLLIRMAIGEVHDAPLSICTLLQSIQLPIANALPPQNCVDWIRAALLRLRLCGYAAKVTDLEMLMFRALAHADLRMEDPENAPFVLDHLGNELLQGDFV
ncbi:uncharacterized protein N7529_000568 [Penicillium soppii]|uniref:uncharacterized protein n=1 Tax=Penicillium soppii TaxID=69789 RepID=UPI002548759D|nr:uncharacterized protein N7529_000568 [Penicillium soppii]KAJ5881896.1 hypothetical protein N7529_000568 [Penicillium soppii]